MIRMAQIAKTLVFLCVLIESQAFPQHDISENKAVKEGVETERQEVMLNVTDVTPPVCRVVNESSDCLLSCGNPNSKSILKLTYLMTDGNGSGIERTRVASYGVGFTNYNTEQYDHSNYTQYDGVDEDGNMAVLLDYSGVCCKEDVEVSVVDKAGNVGKCPVIIKRVKMSNE